MATRLLIVEDEQVSLQILHMVLTTHAGYEVATAENIEEAFEKAETLRPALIISDRYLGKQDGLDLCRRIKADPELRETMFVLLTAASETSHKITGLDAGADDYITKPYNDEELLSRVRALLRIRSLQEDLKREKSELERLNAVLNESLAGTTNLLANIIELRVPHALERARRAHTFVHWVGEKLELDRSSRDLLDLAGRIHEIGKVSVPDEILSRKPGDLSADEAETLAHFPLFGQMIVGNVPQMKSLGRILRHQMENYDGTGLPDRLMKTEIPLLARVLRAVNLLEELSADDTTSTEAIVEHLRASQGKVLEPRIAQLAEEFFVAVINEEWQRDKKQVPVEELEEGMVLAADLSAVSGIKLMTARSRLSRATVEYIQRHHRNDPIAHGIYVFAGEVPA